MNYLGDGRRRWNCQAITMQERRRKLSVVTGLTEILLPTCEDNWWIEHVRQAMVESQLKVIEQEGETFQYPPAKKRVWQLVSRSFA